MRVTIVTLPQMSLECSISNATCGANTFLYLMSDIDVSMLRLLAPHETHAIFWDNFMEPDFSFIPYRDAHAEDTRPSYRETTEALRPLDPHNESAVSALGSLVHRRLLDTTPLLHVRRTGWLSFEFELHQIPRRLVYILNSAGKSHVFARIYANSARYGRHISTVAAAGNELVTTDFCWALLRSAVPDCLRTARLMVTADDAALVEAKMRIELPNRTRYSTQLAKAARNRSPRLAGDDPLQAFCLYAQ